MNNNLRIKTDVFYFNEINTALLFFAKLKLYTR